MRILITNIVVLNGGDGAILFGMIRALRAAFGEETEFIVFASEPAAARRMYPEIEFRETLGLAATRAPRVRYLGRIIRTLRASVYLLCARSYAHGMHFVPRLLLGATRAADIATYASADLVVSGGGTYLKEDYGIDSQVCDYRITSLLGRPLAFYTQSLGPFTQPHSCSALRSVFNTARAVLLRDERSRSNLLDIGVRAEHLHLCPDAAFALADPTLLARAGLRRLPEGRPLRVAISVRHWPHFKDVHAGEGMERYLNLMAGIADWLIRRLGAEVTFFSTCQGNREYQDDSATACRVVERLEADAAARVKVRREFVRFDALLSQLPDYDLVIATRMHMAILALMAGTPAIPVALEFKTEELYASLGLADWVVSAETADPQSARQTIADFLVRLPDLRPALFDRIAKLHAAAMEAGKRISSASRHFEVPHARS